MFKGPFDYSIINRAKEKDQVQIELIDIRDFGIGKHRIVDDKPYGGGHGMILKVNVLKEAIDSTIDKNIDRKDIKIILTSAKGKTFDQGFVSSYSKKKQLIIICGHYEGVDERINKYIDEEISIGDFILTGGEIPAMMITDSVTRLIKGVLKDGVVENESFADDMLEHPQYTRPEEFDGENVPSILLEGNHAKIDNWKEENKKLKLKKD